MSKDVAINLNLSYFVYSASFSLFLLLTSEPNHKIKMSLRFEIGKFLFSGS
jgi:hypothetical protein